MLPWVKRIKLGIVLVTILAISLMACKSEEATSTPISAGPSATDYRIEPIEIDTVEVAVSADAPHQLQVHVKGLLGDGCAEFNGVEQSQDGDTIELTITRRQAAGQPCPEIGVMYDEVIPLQGEFTGAKYILRVNDVEKVVEMDELEPSIGAGEQGVVEAPEEIVQAARQLLMEKLNITAADITLVSAKAMQWRNSSLGCPKPGMNYLDVITPGYQVKLSAQGTIYSIHTNQAATQTLICEEKNEPVNLNDAPTEISDIAIGLVAEELSVAAESVTLVSVEEVHWRDSSLGCPQPGMGYLQVITPGFRVQLEAKGTIYSVHTNQNGSQAVLCKQQMGAATDAEMPPGILKAATNVLVQELDITTDQVTVVSAESVQWRDSSLGCPQPGMGYLQVITPGYRVKLEVDGNSYFVHTDRDGSQAVLCKQETQ